MEYHRNEGFLDEDSNLHNINRYYGEFDNDNWNQGERSV
jgi:hypothetical protein